LRLFLVGILLFSFVLGCARPHDIPGRIESYVVDFSSFQEKNFLITPEPYRGDYDGMGYIEISFRPPVRVKEVETGGVHGSGSTEYQAEQVNLDDSLEKLYEQAVGLGADGIMNFQMRPKTFKVGMQFVEGLVLSGFAIKRKGAF
jgi:hypothetical protein